MGWVSFILDLLRAGSSATAIADFLRGPRTESPSPFAVVPVEEIYSRLSTPLRCTPRYIPRESSSTPSTGLTILLGTSGVGKTRQAACLATGLSKITGASTVYLARGYTLPTASPPPGQDVRRVLVFVDDYDWGCASAASPSFLERQASYVDAAVHIGQLYANLSSRCDLHGMFVTVNTHRLPMSLATCQEVLPAAKVLIVPPATPNEYSSFAQALADVLGISITPEAMARLVAACDGRFDTLATFLQTFTPGHCVTEEDAAEFRYSQRAGWELFSKHLSDDQKMFHGEVKLLRDFGLPPQLDYIEALARVHERAVSRSDIESILASMWPIVNEEPRVYDGQFGPPDRNRDVTRSVVQAAISAAHRRRRKRYAYQDEMKTFVAHLQYMPPASDVIPLLKRLAKWYPRDRLFAYFLAAAHAQRGHSLRAILALYRIFRRPDPRALYSGKWIEIRAHLLLAHLYQKMGSHPIRDWDTHQKIEHEFSLCALLADLEVPDRGAEGYELVATSAPDIGWKDILEKDLKELGYERPSSLSLDTRVLRAVVHHEYSSYLLQQAHMEHDAMRHEQVAAETLPEYGEAFLNCATACLQLGDSSRALGFLARAEGAGPREMESVVFDYILSQGRWRAYMDQGDIAEAKQWFARCVELSKTENLSTDERLRSRLAEIDADPRCWEEASRLAQVRQKVFNAHLTYRIVPANLTIVLPSDWKIDRDGAIGTTRLDMCAVVFASQLAWDEKTKTPSDASIDLIYTSRAEDLRQSGEAYGTSWLRQMNAAFRQRVTWDSEPVRDTLGKTVRLQWNFQVAGPWPKSGFMLVYELGNARIQLKMMCESCGRDKFWPLLCSVAARFSRENFVQN